MQALTAEGELIRLLSRVGVEVAGRKGAFVGRGDDARAAWDAFKLMAATPVDERFEASDGTVRHVDVTSDGDRLLFETAVAERRSAKGWRSFSEPPEPSVFVLYFTRQFSFSDADGEYLGMNGLTLTVEFEPRPDLTGLAAVQIWGCGGPPWDDQTWSRAGGEPRPFAAAQDWIEQVQASKPFSLAFSGHVPTRYFFGQDDY